MSFSKEFKEKNAFSLYNWVTEAMKTTYPSIYMKNHVKLNDYFVDKFNLPKFELVEELVEND